MLKKQRQHLNCLRQLLHAATRVAFIQKQQPRGTPPLAPRKLFAKQIPQTITSFFFILNNLNRGKPVLPHGLNLFTRLPTLPPPLIPVRPRNLREVAELHEAAGVERPGEPVAVQHGAQNVAVAVRLAVDPALQRDETSFFYFIFVEVEFSVTWLRQERGEGGVDVVAGDAGDIAEAGPVKEVATEAALEGGAFGGGDAECGEVEDSREGFFAENGVV